MLIRLNYYSNIIGCGGDVHGYINIIYAVETSLN